MERSGGTEDSQPDKTEQVRTGDMSLEMDPCQNEGDQSRRGGRDRESPEPGVGVGRSLGDRSTRCEPET